MCIRDSTRTRDQLRVDQAALEAQRAAAERAKGEAEALAADLARERQSGADAQDSHHRSLAAVEAALKQGEDERDARIAALQREVRALLDASAARAEALEVPGKQTPRRYVLLHSDGKITGEASARQASGDALADRLQALPAAGKFLWPIPDRGLKRRAYRIKAPTLVLWGENDRIIPAVYAEDFSKLVSGSQMSVVPNAGHLLMIERAEVFSEAVADFLNE